MKISIKKSQIKSTQNRLTDDEKTQVPMVEFIDDLTGQPCTMGLSRQFAWDGPMVHIPQVVSYYPA